jgi:hypothetical protein
MTDDSDLDAARGIAFALLLVADTGLWLWVAAMLLRML